jgi:multidrug efflux system outer membrane protein
MTAGPSTNRQTIAILATLPAALILASCMTAGPNYKKPEVAMPSAFRSQVTASQASSLADLPWWNVFEDKTLQALINEGLANNYDVQVAAARIEQARALVGVAQSEGKPQLGYDAAAGRETTSAPAAEGNLGTVTFNSVGAGLNASWEFDIWGRIRRSTEAAQANLYAQEEVRSGVLLTLVSDIATGYFRLLELDRELGIAEESSRVFGQTRDLFKLRFEAGRDSNLPYQRAEGLYNASLAKTHDLRRLIGQQENALSVLLGGYPRAIVRGRGLLEQVTPETPLGSTTDLLQRRPDIRAAEQTMIRANAEVGVAMANFFPRIGIGALLGGIGVGISDDFDGFTVGRLALSVTGPIFTGGRLQAIYHERQAFWNETVVQYRKTIVIAFQETSDALVAQQTLVARRAALENEVTALRRSSDLALTRYDAGRASYFEVLEAQQQLFPAEDELAQTQRDQLLAVVGLYRALGGGWKTPATGPQSAPAAGLE